MAVPAPIPEIGSGFAWKAALGGMTVLMAVGLTRITACDDPALEPQENATTMAASGAGSTPRRQVQTPAPEGERAAAADGTPRHSEAPRYLDPERDLRLPPGFSWNASGWEHSIPLSAVQDALFHLPLWGWPNAEEPLGDEIPLYPSWAECERQWQDATKDRDRGDRGVEKCKSVTVKLLVNTPRDGEVGLRCECPRLISWRRSGSPASRLQVTCEIVNESLGTAMACGRIDGGTVRLEAIPSEGALLLPPEPLDKASENIAARRDPSATGFCKLVPPGITRAIGWIDLDAAHGAAPRSSPWPMRLKASVPLKGLREEPMRTVERGFDCDVESVRLGGG